VDGHAAAPQLEGGSARERELRVLCRRVRAVGIRNFATGALTLWAAYALALACLPYATAVALALSVLWAVVQGFDTVAYARVGVYRHNTVPASDGLLGRSERKLAKTARAEIA
jgi:hypothetical protein